MTKTKPTWVPHRPDTWPARYGELKRDTTLSWYQGRWENNEPVMRNEIVQSGTTVKIVMVSRLGDVGITNRLDADVGYGARVHLDDIDNLRANP